MNKQSTRTIIILSGFALLALFSYLNFQDYRPKVLKQVMEVKGVSAKSSLTFPYMEGTKEIGTSDTASGKQTTLEISRTVEEIKNYYKNVLLDRDWRLQSSVESGDLVIDSYKNEDHLAKISISRESTSSVTVVSILVK